MKSTLWFFFLLFFISLARADYYRFDPHGWSFSRKLNELFVPVFNQGRMQIYRIKKRTQFKGLPPELLGNLVKIKKDEWKVISSENLDEKIPHSLSIQSILEKISEKNVREHLEFLVGRSSRKMVQLVTMKTNYIEKFLKSYGYQTKKECFKKRSAMFGN